jgi:uncharacterized protein
MRKLVCTGLMLVGLIAPSTAEQLQPAETDDVTCHLNVYSGENDDPLENALDLIVIGEFGSGLTYIRRLAENGDCEAQSTLGYMYKVGRGVKKDYAEAAKWFRRAATRDDHAQNHLGLLYVTGLGVSQSYVEAAKWFRLAANQGHAVAQFNLGVMYETGQGVSQDYAEAAKWYLLAAESHMASQAAFNLGVMYETGKGVQQNYVEALKWYRKAIDVSEHDDCSPQMAVDEANAQYALGTMYENGRGVQQDSKLALNCYVSAADRGVTDAQSRLGGLYEIGQWVPRDYVLAYMWFNLAARHSVLGSRSRELAERGRERVVTHMTSEELSKAQKLTKEWKRTSRAIMNSRSLIYEWFPNSNKETIRIFLQQGY